MSHTIKCIAISLLVSVVFAPSVVFAATGTIDATHRYAWSESVGWIDFGSTNGSVSVSNTELTGYAWNENVGWISLNCSNTSSCGAVDFRVANTATGVLSGYAWSESVGWIDFAPDSGGVTIDQDGNFVGYAWNENTGWIVFNCATTDSCTDVAYKVATDWRPTSQQTAQGGATVGISRLDDSSTLPTPIIVQQSVTFADVPTPPAQGFTIQVVPLLFRDDSEVQLFLPAGEHVAYMAISNFADFWDAHLEPYYDSKVWNFCQNKLACELTDVHTVYVKYFTAKGRSSPLITQQVTWDAQVGSLAVYAPEPLTTRVRVVQDSNTANTRIIVRAEPSAVLSDQQVLGMEEALPPIAPEVLFGIFKRDLGVDSEGYDVKALQQFLNASGFFIAEEDIGSPGNETLVFGDRTQAALVRFQTNYQDKLRALQAGYEPSGVLDITTRTFINLIQAELETL